MDPRPEMGLLLTRRHFFGLGSSGIGTAALATLLNRDLGAAVLGRSPSSADRSRGLPGYPHFAPTAKRVIYLFQSGAPSQMELFDYKPGLQDLRGTELPDSIRKGQRLTGMTATQSSFPVAPTLFKFGQHGQSGAWVSELMPHTAGIVDDISFVKSMHTEAINHDPAVTFFQTGAQLAGRPSIGSWISYGLGSDTEDLPSFSARSAWKTPGAAVSSKRSPPPSIHMPGLGQAPSLARGLWLQVLAMSMAAWSLSRAASSSASVTGMGADAPSRASARHRSGCCAAST